MKISIHFRHSLRRLTIRAQPLAHAVAMAIAIYSGNTLAQTVNFPPVPLSTATAVPANLLYIHDDSNSMYWSFMPDEIHWQSPGTPNGYDFVFYSVPFEFYRSPDFNKMYYNPAVRYVPPPAPPGVTVIGADGQPVTDGTLGNAQFSNAWYNGYDLETRNQAASYISYTNPTPSPGTTPNVAGVPGTKGTVYRRVNLGTSFIQTDYSSMIFGKGYPAPNSNYRGYPIQGVRQGSYSAYGSTTNSCYWTHWYDGLCGAGEFLPMNPEPAHYYRCQPSAWSSYPNPAVGPFNTGKCEKFIITSEAEKQNFANWYSYYRTRNYASKAGIGRAFEKLDPNVRLGWGLINKKNFALIDGKNVNTVIQGVRTFDQARKKQFLEWLYKVQPASMNNPPVFISTLASTEKDAGGTPLRRALDSAGQYFDRQTLPNSLGPWADNPASSTTVPTAEKAAACRKSFTILMTDGYWNSAAAATPGIVNVNVDGNAPNPFRDSYANTLADISWYYWSKKLVPATIPSKVPKTPVPGTPSKFRDDAEYQHMTTFTIGLGVAGKIDKDKAFRAIHDPSAGSITWPNPLLDNAASEKIDDLLHAAVNGHGDFFSASNPEEFVTGMSNIINAVNSAQKLSSGNLDSDASQVSTDTHIFRTYFRPGDWSGELQKLATVARKESWTNVEVWRASEQMPSPAARKIYTRNSNNSGTPFIWNDLDSTLQSALRGPSQSLDGHKVLEYIRGSNANEGPASNQFRFRYRFAHNRAPLGASPNNSPVFVKYGNNKTSIFLGADDGMLHAFDGASGAEQFAYIPSALVPKLAGLTNEYGSYVDGNALVTTPAQTPNHYLLVGALGRGGKGLYGLDVTNPTAFHGDNVKWELNSPQICPDPDSGSTYLGNVIGSLAYANINGKPSVVFGNGYNSCSDKAALGIVNIVDGSANFIKASDELNNGLAAPRIFENTTTHGVSAYAGDLHGKMWKFGLIPLLGTSTKIFETGTSNQPITAPPLAMLLNTDSEAKKTYVYFGTGRYLSASDKTTTAQQSLYGVLDANASAPSLDELERRTLALSTEIPGTKTTAKLPSNINMDDKKGWYIPLTEKGERVVHAPVSFRGLIIFTTIIPPIDGDGLDPCSIKKGSGWLYSINPKTGDTVPITFTDLVTGAEVHSNIQIGAPGLLDGMPGQAIVIGDNEIILCGPDSDNCMHLEGRNNDPPPEDETNTLPKGRISWREIVN